MTIIFAIFSDLGDVFTFVLNFNVSLLIFYVFKIILHEGWLELNEITSVK